MNPRVIIHLLTLLISLCSAVLFYSDKISELTTINPKLAHAWGLVLIAAGILEQISKAVIDFLNPPKP